MDKLLVAHKEIYIKCKGETLTVLVDAEDYDFLSRHVWHLTGANCFYAGTFFRSAKAEGRQNIILMHRMIMGGWAYIDHINGNCLDNRKCNLRIATHQENGWNKGKAKGGRFGKFNSQYKGVSKHTTANGKVEWRVIIKTTAKGVRPAKFVRRGPFNSEIEAARVYNEEIVKLRGEFAWVNQIPLTQQI